MMQCLVPGVDVDVFSTADVKWDEWMDGCIRTLQLIRTIPLREHRPWDGTSPHLGSCIQD